MSHNSRSSIVDARSTFGVSSNDENIYIWIAVMQTAFPATENTGTIRLGPIQSYILLLHNINASQILEWRSASNK